MENNAQNTAQNETAKTNESPVLGKVVLTLDRPHRSQKDGKTRFIYILSGDQAAIDQYVADKAADGFNAKRPDGKVTYFGNKLVPNGTELVKQTKGYWFPVNEKFEVLTAATKDYGYDLAKDLVDGKLNK